MLSRIRDGVASRANQIATKTSTALHYLGVGGSVIAGGYHALWAMARAAAGSKAVMLLAETTNSTATDIATASRGVATNAIGDVDREVIILSTGIALGSIANIIDSLNTANQNSKVAASIARRYPLNGEVMDQTTGLPEELTSTDGRTKAERVGFGMLTIGATTLAILGGLFITANPITGAVLFFTADLSFFGATTLLDLSFHNEARRLNELEAKLPSAPQLTQRLDENTSAQVGGYQTIGYSQRPQ